VPLEVVGLRSGAKVRVEGPGESSLSPRLRLNGRDELAFSDSDGERWRLLDDIRVDRNEGNANEEAPATVRKGGMLTCGA
jgi:hypothetical protein